MDLIIFLAAVLLAIFCFRFINKSHKDDGYRPIVRVMSAATLSVLTFLSVVIFFSAGGISGLLVGLLVAAVIYVHANKKQFNKLLDVSVDKAPEQNYSQSAIAKAVYGSDDRTDDPLAKWRTAEPAPSSRYGPVAEIEFDYRDSKGNKSHRHIAVESVDNEYLQGYCHDACDTRTFVIGRILGKIIDCETGELIAPKAWAAAARKNVLNDPNLISDGFDRDFHHDHSTGGSPQKSASIEICFTGFAKADKSNLEEMAESAGMIVRKSVTNGLTHLCAGPNAGPSKLIKAEEAGAEVIDEGEFYGLFAES